MADDLLLDQLQKMTRFACTKQAVCVADLVAQHASEHKLCSQSTRLLVSNTLCQQLFSSIEAPTTSVLMCTTAKIHNAQQPQTHLNRQNKCHLTLPTETASPVSSAQAWKAASAALDVIYTWDDEQVVMCMIDFWSSICKLLSGCWLQSSQTAASRQGGGSPDPATALQAYSPTISARADNPDELAEAAPLCAVLLDLQYLQWLWHLGTETVAALVEQLQRFYKATGINHLQHYHQNPRGQHSGALNPCLSLLLVYLQLHTTQESNNSALDVGRSCTRWSLDSNQAAAQLVELLFGGQVNAAAGFSALMSAGEAFSRVCSILQAAAVMQMESCSHDKARTASTTQCTPKSAEGRTQHAAAYESAGADSCCSQQQWDPPSAPGVASAVPGMLEDAPGWEVLARRAGSLLQASYGWSGFGEPCSISAAAAAAAAGAVSHAALQSACNQQTLSEGSKRSTVESLYDCFMMMMLHEMLHGPKLYARSRIGQPFLWTDRPALCLEAGSASALHAAVGATACGAAPLSQDGVTSLSEDAWDRWIHSCSFHALAAFVATYDRPDVLVRGLVTLSQHELMAAANAAASKAADVCDDPSPLPPQKDTKHVKKAAGCKLEAVVLSRVLQLLEKVFLWQTAGLHAHPSSALEAQTHIAGSSSAMDDARADAAGVCQLLFGLSEMLRPAGNCSVSWRCAALASMLSAVEDFHERHPDAGDVATVLWCDKSVEGLLYCANHDPSIQARRGAVQLLQQVVVPSNSALATAVVRCLANKLSDRDDRVSLAALQLFVQLDPGMLYTCLTAAQWCTAMQAALRLVCESVSAAELTRQSRASKRQGTTASEECQKQFVGLLQKVMLLSTGPQQYVQHQMVAECAAPVGREGCKRILQLLLLEPALADSWQVLLESM